MEFKGWAKTPRLDSPFIITEKIDGTNSAVVIEPHDPSEDTNHEGYFTQVRSAFDPYGKPVDEGDEWVYNVGAQSRSRLIRPGKTTDNFGFAAWVEENAQDLVDALGVGRHFGEWWGSGIQRGYGLTKGEKRFSLFNVTRYEGVSIPEIGLGVVPILDLVDRDCTLFEVAGAVDRALQDLAYFGSYAVDKYMNPEGIVLFHSRSGQTFKKYIDPSQKAANR